MFDDQVDNVSRGSHRNVSNSFRQTNKTSSNEIIHSVPVTCVPRTVGTSKLQKHKVRNEPICKQINATSEEESAKSCGEEEKAKSLKASEDNASGLVNNFAEPKLLTSLKIIESFHNLVKDNQKKPQCSRNDCIAPKKASRKVNIPFEEKVFKGLIDLKVNDEELGLNLNGPLKPKEILKIKEPEPVLSDYYTPRFDREYVVKPKMPKFDASKLKMPKVPSVLEMTKRWEPDDFY